MGHFYFMVNINTFLEREITTLSSKHFLDLDFDIVFTNKDTIGSFFLYKNHISILVQSKGVCKYTCEQCNAPIIGRLQLVTYTHVLLNTRGYRPVQEDL